MELGTTLKGFEQSLESIPEHDARANVGPRAFVIAFIFCVLGDRGKRSLASIRRGVMGAVGQEMSRAAFWERISTGRLFHFLLFLAEDAIKKVAGIGFASGQIEALLLQLGVKGILIIDSSSNSLPDMAGAVFPGPRRTILPSAIKWHSCFDLFRGAVKWFDISPGTSHDQNHFPDLSIFTGYLVIVDLGYFDYCLLQAIANVGGFFLCRLKKNSLVRIARVIEGLPKKWKGKLLRDNNLPRGKDLIEIRGLFSDGLFEFRVIGFWNPCEKSYHWYVTNLLVPARLIYPLYRLRWQVELLFKTAKSSLRLSDISSANPNIIHSLLLSSIIATTMSQAIGMRIARMCQQEKRTRQMPSLQRAGCVGLQLLSELRDYFLNRTKESLSKLKKKIRLFYGELFDPNKKRESSIQRVIRVANEAA